MANPRFHRKAVRLAAAVYEPTSGGIRNAIDSADICSALADIVDGPGPLFERALVAPTTEVNYIVFRGTQNRAQWASNLNVLKQLLFEAFDGKTHRGFRKGLYDLLPSIKALLNQRHGNRPLVIAGHSRGAAEAVIFACIAKMLNIEVAEIHLFGCPRALNKPLARLFDQWFFERTWNWISNNDAVYRVPFKWMGYRHVGTRMYFDHKSRLSVDPDWTLRLKGQLFGRLTGGLFDGWSDHNAVKEYRRLIGCLEFADG